MNVLAGLMHCHSRKRHPVFPTDQAADTGLRDLDGAEASAVAGSPNKTLSKCRDKLGMMIGYPAIRRKRLL
jgi:hypothetical protein